MRALAVLLLLVASPAPEHLLWKPQSGWGLRTTFERNGSVKLESMTMEIDGQQHGDMPTPELTLEVHDRRTFVDRYAKVEDGQVLELERLYEALDASRHEMLETDDGSHDREYSAESEIAGKRVRFAREAAEDDFDRSFVEFEGDGALLDGLSLDTDLSGFLPEREVSEGDSWDVPASAFGALTAFGGDLHLIAEGKSINENDLALAQSCAGDLRATLRGAREEDGVEVQVIELEIEVDAHAEHDLDGEREGSTSIRNHYELTGELLWDAGLKRARSLVLSGNVKGTLADSATVEMNGRTFETVRTTVLAGEVEYKVLIGD